VLCSGDEHALNSSGTSKVGVSFFRHLIATESTRLTMLCAIWRTTMDSEPELSDEGS